MDTGYRTPATFNLDRSMGKKDTKLEHQRGKKSKQNKSNLKDGNMFGGASKDQNSGTNQIGVKYTNSTSYTEAS